MKKIFLLFFAVLLSACSYQNVNELESQLLKKQQTNNIRSIDEAYEIAQKSISLLNGSDVTRSTSVRKINKGETKVYVKDSRTRSTSFSKDTLMYVFNFEDNQGFAIIAAQKNVEPLLSITEKGHYVPGEKTGIEGFDFFVEKAESYLLKEKESPRAEITDIMEQIVYTGNIGASAGPYVTVQWGQQYPEGEFCSNGICGCNNTAMAQIMSYFNYPTSISLTYADRDIDTQSLNWTSMKAHAAGHSLSDCIPTNYETHTMIGRLCRQLGELCHSTYYPQTGNNPASTGTNTPTYTASVFSSLGYTTNNWNSLPNINLKTELNNAHLLLTIGLINSDEGHAWVMDGYTELEYMTYIYHKEGIGNLSPWILFEIVGPSYKSLYHLNWGWYGINNGYFSYNVFNTSDVINPDTNNNFVSYNFYDIRFLSVYR